MRYIYEYPHRIQDINRRRYGRITIPESHLAQTHDELLQVLDISGKTYSLRFDVRASRTQVWENTAGSIDRFFAHHYALAGVTSLDDRGAAEGARHILHRELNGGIIDRLSEVLISLPMVHLTVSDLDVADPSVSGYFPTLHTIRLESMQENLTQVLLSYTFLGVPHPMVIELLHRQALSIKSTVEDLVG